MGLSLNNRKKKYMKTDQTFTITFTKQNGESTTRKAKWTDKCQEFVATPDITV